MKTYFISFAFCLIIISFNSQGQNKTMTLDSIPVDLRKVDFDRDTLFFDVNSDNLKDILVMFIYKNNVPIPKGESGQMLAIYLNSGNGIFRFMEINKSLLWLIHNQVRQIDTKTFLVINEGGGQDWNRYYCYFLFDEKVKNWFLYRTEVYKAYYKTGEDKESKTLISKKEYNQDTRIPFNQVSFDSLFGKLRADVPEPAYYERIFVNKSFIYKEPNVKTKIYLIKGDEVKIVKEENGFLKIFYYGKKTIEGWIKKSDVE
jgi:hypothetical protein